MPKHEPTKLKTTGQVIAALGGHARVAEMTGTTYKRVWDWGAGTTFPSRHFLLMWLALAGRGFAAEPSLWGQTAGQANEGLLAAVARKARAAA